ncbi:MAG: efflux RND transporter periplasmic adaptor subunit [Pseudomonadota bacterium]
MANFFVYRVCGVSGVCVLLAFLLGCEDPQPTPEKEIVRTVKSLKLGDANLQATLTFPGKVEASEKAELGFLVAGRLIKLPIKEGQFVEKDQLIGQLDPKDFEIKVGEEKAKRDLKRVEFARYSKLLKSQFVSQAKVDTIKAELDVAQANLDTALRDLEYTTLRAPFDGLIARRYVENFQNVKQKQKVVHIHDISYIDVSINVPEYVVISRQEKADMEFLVEFETAQGKQYSASFKEFSSAADPITQTYNVTLIMPAPKDLAVFPGMTVTVTTIIKNPKGEENHYLIPTEAVFADEDDGRFVWVINPKTMRLKKREVKVGSLANGKILVKKGLKRDDSIVTAGVHFLRENTKVKLLTTTARN